MSSLRWRPLGTTKEHHGDYGFFLTDFVSACENKLVSIPYVQHKASASGAQMTTEKNI